MHHHLHPANFSARYYNSDPPPAIKPVHFSANTIFADGTGQASTERIQFNVNRPSTGGAVFLDPANPEGVVELSITSDHVFLDGWAVVMQDGSATYTPGHAPHDIDRCVSVSTVMESNKKLTFYVHRMSDLDGNVTMTFFVRYKAAV